jgi:hypothetical protein
VTDHCTDCGCEIHQFLTGRKRISGEVHCDKCYYKKLGEVVEEHPIGMPLGRSPYK